MTTANKDKAQHFINIIADAYTTKKRDNDEDYTCIDDTKETAELVKEVQFKLNDITQSFELDYEIMSDATYIISERETVEELENADFYELATDQASVYTETQLSYLNIWNQDEISGIAKEFSSDIGTACAVWYDQQVQQACEMLRDKILEYKE